MSHSEKQNKANVDKIAQINSIRGPNLISGDSISAANSYFSIPVSLLTGICDSGLVCVFVEDVVGIPDRWRSPTGHWVTNGWRPIPCQTSETMELIGDLRQEAILAAEVNDDRGIRRGR